MAVFWNRKGDEKSYAVPLGELTHLQVAQQILVTLERMEDILINIEAKMGGVEEGFAKAAEVTAAGINANTALLSQISLPDPATPLPTPNPA